MFLDKYLNDTYLDILYSNYEIYYLNSLDEDNFDKVYKLLKDNNFNFLPDIIINYLEIFTIEVEYISKALNDIKKILTDDYVTKISKDMTLITKIIDLAISYSLKEN